MRFQAEPLVLRRRPLQAAACLGAIALLLAGMWAFLPIDLVAGRNASASGASASGVAFGQEPEPRASATALPVAGTFDPEAFAVRLWSTQPRAGAEVRAGTSAEALRFQLVGITEEAGELYAALYDPRSDRLHIVRNGDEISGHTVAELTLAGVRLLANGRAHYLALAGAGS